MKYYTPWMLLATSAMSMAFPNPEPYSFYILGVAIGLGMVIDLLETSR